MGIAVGPVVGGLLGHLSWRGPFYGVSGLMVIAMVATIFLVPATPKDARATSLTEPLAALRHRGLLITGLTALLYNFGFFTLLAFTPFPLDLGALQIGAIFFGWGALLAITSVWVAPRLQRRCGTLRPITWALVAFTVILAVMAVFTGNKVVLAVGVILAGGAIGINNTLITETVMKSAPVERGVASAAYSFVRFAGGAVAPWLAGTLGEEVSMHLPFWVGAVCVLGAAVLITAGRKTLAHVDSEGESEASLAEAEELTAADS